MSTTFRILLLAGLVICAVATALSPSARRAAACFRKKTPHTTPMTRITDSSTVITVRFIVCNHSFLFYTFSSISFSVFFS